MKRFITAITLVAVLTPAAAHAARTVTSPYVDQGVLKLKSKTGITEDDERASRDGALQQKFGAEYGITDRFSVEGEFNIDNPGNENNSDLTTFEIKGKGLFTEKGKYWLDAGARLTYEKTFVDGPDAVELKFILAKDTEKFRHIANFILTREVGEDSSDDTEGGFSWSSRYKWNKHFEPGFEMYNNFGAIGDSPDFEDQDHSIGPVVYGKIDDHLKYELGYLAGFSDNAADGRFKAILEYGIKF